MMKGDLREVVQAPAGIAHRAGTALDGVHDAGDTY
ncbi:unannotated protein [freshwater metagenome]|uniref:Unannotated protein n=1 Tax=freshwater metagenome TaxID=449393 RepID=A0A6J7MRH9_9ZZZZ